MKKRKISSSSSISKKSASAGGKKKKSSASSLTRKHSPAAKRSPGRQDYSRDTKPYYEPTFHGKPPEFQPEVKPAPAPYTPSYDLPSSYNKTKIVLLVRDPYWVYSYWDISGDTYQWIEGIRRDVQGKVRTVLRVYDVTDIDFNGSNAHRYYDIDCHLDAKNWYIDLGTPDRAYIVDLGLIDGNGKFYLIARSNVVRTPRDGPSDIVDEAWMAADFEEIYALSGGFGIGLSSGEMKARGKRIMKEWLSSGGISSPGFFLKRTFDEKGNTFQIASEIVFYGKAPQDAQVTVAGKPVVIRKDGTFSIRYFLPDGAQSIPIKMHLPRQGETKEAILEVRKEAT
ncbi:MAG: DUF4912 domain-containing protein [Candidatus Omnitrophica bacterium]|nr:DUF4912 domain-containing protein [Candidatus Omnitrophota bacterium]